MFNLRQECCPMAYFYIRPLLYLFFQFIVTTHVSYTCSLVAAETRVGPSAAGEEGLIKSGVMH